jgi:hypothetical protein
MTKDDIIRMARKAADYWANHYGRKSKADMELLQKHVAEKFLEIAAAEREECAKVCEKDCGNGALNLAAAIRARGE